MKYKTEWDLGHIYKGDVKKLVARDLATTKKSYLVFAKKYRTNKKHLKDPRALAKAIEEYEKLSSDPTHESPGRYYSYRRNLNSEDNEPRPELVKLNHFFTKLANELEFFMLEIAKIDKSLQKRFLSSKELAPFKYFLKKVFENAKHNLSEPEEKIMNLKGLPSHGMWVSGFSKLLAKQMIKFNGKNIPISEAGAKVSTLPTKERRSLHKEVMRVYESVSDFAESEINAIVTNKKINDKL